MKTDDEIIISHNVRATIGTQNELRVELKLMLNDARTSEREKIEDEKAQHIETFGEVFAERKKIIEQQTAKEIFEELDHQTDWDAEGIIQSLKMKHLKNKKFICLCMDDYNEIKGRFLGDDKPSFEKEPLGRKPINHKARGDWFCETCKEWHNAQQVCTM